MVSGTDMDFCEIGHCGGQYTVKTKTDSNGKRTYQLGVQSSSPHPAAFFTILATGDGIPVGTVSLSWQPDRVDEPTPTTNTITVFIASDRRGMFGHACPTCSNYWRSNSAPSDWPTTCPYCGIRAAAHQFLTAGQRKFVDKCCAQVLHALSLEHDDEHVIDMDAIADEIQKGAEVPAFYYVEESQQSRFTCDVCRTANDILGKFGYCSCCGYRNNLQLLTQELESIHVRLRDGDDVGECVRQIVSNFDSCGQDYVSQLVAQVPMTRARQNRASKIVFHDYARILDDLKSVFDIDIAKGIDESKSNFLSIMFQRRHVFEHNGGVVDERYLERSGDTNLRLGQAIRETHENAARFAKTITNLAKKLDEGFHEILPPNETAVRRCGRRAA